MNHSCNHAVTSKLPIRGKFPTHVSIHILIHYDAKHACTHKYYQTWPLRLHVNICIYCVVWVWYTCVMFTAGCLGVRYNWITWAMRYCGNLMMGYLIMQLTLYTRFSSVVNTSILNTPYFNPVLNWRCGSCFNVYTQRKKVSSSLSLSFSYSPFFLLTLSHQLSLSSIAFTFCSSLPPGPSLHSYYCVIVDQAKKLEPLLPCHWQTLGKN